MGTVIKESDEADAATLFKENRSAIYTTKSPQYHGRSKHISIK